MFDIINAKYIKDYKIEFFFADNSSGILDFSDYKKKSGLFEALQDVTYFKHFKFDNDLGTIVWENGLDIAPDTIYYKAKGILPPGLIDS